jgi:signal transduction histidine kinase
MSADIVIVNSLLSMYNLKNTGSIKATGQGTDPGLGLDYDIAKTHRGEIKVETKEGKGTEFIIQLPKG